MRGYKYFIIKENPWIGRDGDADLDIQIQRLMREMEEKKRWR